MLLKTKIPLRYIFGGIRTELFFVFFYAGIIALENKYIHLIAISIPLSVPMVLGTVLSLLLAFKSNQAYDRWWEARVVWGAVVNDSRTLVRQILCFAETPYDSEEMQNWQARLTNRQIAWPYALGMTLRKQMEPEKISPYLSPEELEFVATHENIPNALLQLHAQDLRHALQQGWINRYQQIELDNTLTKLTDSMGRCERIKNTVFPVTYSLYTHFCLFFFVLLLPFALLDVFGMLGVFVVLAISAAFFLIEKMAIHLQDPFEDKPTDTPVTAIAQTIERNLKQMTGDHQAVRQVKVPDSHFFML
ncbi:hypothetical protein D0N36_03340 [Hymenobacter lapidiphilus]|nr:hypothetical protein D0N36_03340 [Hymenobacter sp. CCM 8763]